MCSKAFAVSSRILDAGSASQFALIPWNARCGLQKHLSAMARLSVLGLSAPEAAEPLPLEKYLLVFSFYSYLRRVLERRAVSLTTLSNSDVVKSGSQHPSDSNCPRRGLPPSTLGMCGRVDPVLKLGQLITALALPSFAA